MKISEIIAQLEAIKAEHGDLDSRVQFNVETTSEFWEEPLDGISVLKWDDGTLRVGFIASDENDDEEDFDEGADITV